MKKIKQNKIVFTCILLISVMLGNAQEIKLYKYGFINKIGKEITALKYDDANSFSEGIAKVCIKGKWGFINAAGEEITALKYDTAYTCESGVARIKLDGKYGLIDKTGKEITPLKYDNISRFDYGVACVRINGKWGIINDKGIEITPIKYDYMRKANSSGILCLKGKDKITLVDEIGKPIESNPLGYFSDRRSYFDESGIAKVCLNGKWGFIDKTGKEISALKYDYVFFFSEGMARVLLNKKWGFIDESGTEVIPLTYDFLDEELGSKSSCEEGYIFSNRDTPLPIYLDKEGELVDYYDLENIKEQHTYFNHGLVRINAANLPEYKGYRPNLSLFGGYSGRKPEYVFLDKKGNEVKSAKYDSVVDLYYNHGRDKMKFYYDGLRKVEKYVKGEYGLRYGFADTFGKMIIPLKYDSAENFVDGVAEVGLGMKYGLIDKTGKQVTPLKYDSMWNFYDGIARVNIKGCCGRRLWGIINNKGEELTSIKYDFIDDFSEGLAKVELNRKIGFINNKGKEVVVPQYSNASSFSEGFAEVVYKKVGFIDKTGKAITPFKYDETESFENGFARVSIDDKWGFINKTGQEITPLKYDKVESFNGGCAVVKMLTQ